MYLDLSRCRNGSYDVIYEPIKLFVVAHIGLRSYNILKSVKEPSSSLFATQHRCCLDSECFWLRTLPLLNTSTIPEYNGY